MKDHIGNILPIDSLPQTCIYMPEKGAFYQYYDIDEICLCGCSQWCKDKIDMKLSECQFDFPQSFINRCTECRQIRLAHLKKKYEKIFKLSNSIVETLRKLNIDNSELLDIIGNTYAKVGFAIYGEKFIEGLNEFSQL